MKQMLSGILMCAVFNYDIRCKFYFIIEEGTYVRTFPSRSKSKLDHLPPVTEYRLFLFYYLFLYHFS